MKKILSGILYRFFRSVETWVLVALILTATAYIAYAEYSSLDFADVFAPTSIRYEDLDVSAEDTYKYNYAELDEETYNKLDNDNVVAGSETDLILKLFNIFPLVPNVLMVIFIPVFFGRLFSDGTIKNLISGGHSKGSIYFSSLLFCMALNFVLLLLSVGIYVIWGLIYGWHPPIYLPIVLVMFLIDLLLSFTLSSFCLAVLFMSSKKTLAFIASFILVISLFLHPAVLPQLILTMTQQIDAEGEDINNIRKANDEAPYKLEIHFKYSEAEVEFHYEGDVYCFFGDSTLPKGVKNALLVWIYSDPGLTMNFGSTLTAAGPYMLYRDGVMATNVINNVFWITAVNALGVIVFKKREIK